LCSVENGGAAIADGQTPAPLELKEKYDVLNHTCCPRHVPSWDTLYHPLTPWLRSAPRVLAHPGTKTWASYPKAEKGSNI